MVYNCNYCLMAYHRNCKIQKNKCYIQPKTYTICLYNINIINAQVLTAY